MKQRVERDSVIAYFLFFLFFLSVGLNSIFFEKIKVFAQSLPLGDDDKVVYLNGTKILSEIGASQQINTHQVVRIPEAGRYVFKVKAKVYSEPQNIHFLIMCLKPEGCKGGKKQFESYVDITPNEISDWREYTKEVDLPAEDVVVALFAYYSGEVAIDYVALYKKGTNYNLLKNADFTHGRRVSLDVKLPEGWGAGGSDWSGRYIFVDAGRKKLFLNSSSSIMYNTQQRDGKYYYTNEILWTRLEKAINSGNYAQIRVKVKGKRVYYKNWGSAKRGLSVVIACAQNQCPDGKKINENYSGVDIGEELKEYSTVANVPKNTNLLIRIFANDGTEGIIENIRIEGLADGSNWSLIHYEDFSRLREVNLNVWLPADWWAGTNDWEKRYLMIDVKRYCDKPQQSGNQILDPVHCGYYTQNTQNNCPKKPQGDANCDGKIDDIDYEIWKNFFKAKREGSPIPIHLGDPDFNNDRVVDLVDFEIWRRNYFPNQSITTAPTRTPTLTPTPTNRPSPTPVPTRSQTPTIPNVRTPRCTWCGNQCVSAVERVRICPQSAPPPGANCVYEPNRGCVIRYGNLE